MLAWSDVISLWVDDSPFRDAFTRTLAASPFSAYRWETPPVSRESVAAPFEFVLLNRPGFSSRTSDEKTFANYFTDDDTDDGIVKFKNLRGDASLIVPSPRADKTAYGHLAAFVRKAPSSQTNSIWRIVGSSISSQLKLSDQPIWLNTAGGGVAWLHVRLDSRPKYYGYASYRFQRGE